MTVYNTAEVASRHPYPPPKSNEGKPEAHRLGHQPVVQDQKHNFAGHLTIKHSSSVGVWKLDSTLRPGKALWLKLSSG